MLLFECAQHRLGHINLARPVFVLGMCLGDQSARPKDFMHFSFFGRVSGA